MSFDWAPPALGEAGPAGPVRSPATQPYRPDTVIDGWSAEGFEVRAASVRGAAHRASGTPRQDEFAVATHPSGAIVAVVADGISNAELSHLGATMVCRTVVDYLLHAGPSVDWPDLLRCAGWALVEYAARQLDAGDPDPQRAEKLLASTVVVALVRPVSAERAVAELVRVGDSAAWRLRDGRWEPVFPPEPEAELLPDGVAALPRVPAAVTPVEIELAGDDVLVLGTDGFGEPLGDGTGRLGRLFGDGLATPPPMTRLAWMLDFTGGPWDDDRTVLAVWRHD